MKRIVLAIGAMTVLGLFSIPASAGDYFYRVIRNNNHARHHDDLDHRAFHRELTHRDAHRYPMSYRQHGRLHDSLDHEAFHDGLEHRSAHRNRVYAPRYYTPSYRYGYGSGIGFRTRGVSLWFGF
jgi:hypothetical protein